MLLQNAVYVANERIRVYRDRIINDPAGNIPWLNDDLFVREHVQRRIEERKIAFTTAVAALLWKDPLTGKSLLVYGYIGDSYIVLQASSSEIEILSEKTHSFLKGDKIEGFQIKVREVGAGDRVYAMTDGVAYDLGPADRKEFKRWLKDKLQAPGAIKYKVETLIRESGILYCGQMEHGDDTSVAGMVVTESDSAADGRSEAEVEKLFRDPEVKVFVLNKSPSKFVPLAIRIEENRQLNLVENIRFELMRSLGRRSMRAYSTIWKTIGLNVEPVFLMACFSLMSGY
jgi:hypothetical protein